MNGNPFRLGQRPAGFRIFFSDMSVAFCVMVVAWFIWYWAQGDKLYQLLALLPLVILGHFFLFCNVFRISRKLELVWGIVFIIVALAHLDFDRRSPAAWLFWLSMTTIQSPITVAVLIWAIFTEDYHGIGYRLIPWGRKIKSR